MKAAAVTPPFKTTLRGDKWYLNRMNLFSPRERSCILCVHGRLAAFLLFLVSVFPFRVRFFV